MRRRRPHLQVSLFPFLSVLLCMLGALILLLLVLDQKARHARAAQSLAQALAQKQDAEEHSRALQLRLAAELEGRLAALRLRRDELHQETNRQLASEARAQAQLKDSEADLAALQRLLDAELRRAEELASAARQQGTEAQNVRDRRSAAQSELDRLLQQLRTLEQVIQRLQQALEQRPPVYTLAPYRGKQGTRRPPLYLECVDSQLVFQPDGERLSLVQSQMPGRVLAAIEDRIKGQAPRQPGDYPYILLLIRPSGLSLYYAVVRALQKSDVDIGYEFINEDWVLDFATVDDAKLAGAGGPPQKPGGGVKGAGGGSREGAANPSIASTGSTNKGSGGSDSASTNRMPPGRGAAGGAGAGTGWKPGGDAAPLGHARGGGRTERTTTPGANPAGQASSTGPVSLLPPTPTQPPGSTANPSTAGSSGESGTASPASGAGAAGSAAAGRSEGTENAERPALRPPGAAPRPVGGPPAREWQIIIECQADGVLLEASGRRFSMAEVYEPGTALRTAVQELVLAKRQRLPDVRPEIRFLIRPEGLRAYYAAAAALEPLRLPIQFEVHRDGGKSERSKAR